MRLDARHLVPLLALISFAVVLPSVPADDRVSLAALSLGSGVAALSMMGTAAVLGARWPVVERALGGLDRVYQAHKWLGVAAVGFASVHLLFKAGAEGWEVASILTLPSFWTRLVRQSAYVALVLVVMMALNRNLPYSAWRIWHKASGPAFALVVLHWLSFRSPVTLDSAAGAWLATISILGIGSAAYKLLLDPWLSRRGTYEVAAVQRGPHGVRLELAPVSGGLTFEPGQFAFLSLQAPGLREPHPFTIASGGPGGRLQFVIRALGDHTERLVAQAQQGMRAEVSRAFGRFRRPAGSRREVWIGGGVGISPFLAWATADDAPPLDRVTLFYFFTPGREFPPAAELAGLAAERGIEFHAVPTGPSTPAFQARFAELVREAGPEHVDVLFCGPEGLRRAVRRLMAEHGVPQDRLQYEVFAFR